MAFRYYYQEGTDPTLSGQIDEVNSKIATVEQSINNITVNYVPKNNPIVNANLIMSNNRITQLANGINGNDAITKSQLDEKRSLFVSNSTINNTNGLYDDSLITLPFNTLYKKQALLLKPIERTPQTYTGTLYTINDFSTFQNTISLLNNGDRIDITSNITLTSTLTIDKTIRLYSSNNSILSSSQTTTLVFSGDNVLIENITINNSSTSSVASTINFTSTTANNNIVRNATIQTNEFAIQSTNNQIQIVDCRFELIGTPDSQRFINLQKTTGTTIIHNCDFIGYTSTQCIFSNTGDFTNGTISMCDNKTSAFVTGFNAVQRLAMFENTFNSNSNLRIICLNNKINCSSGFIIFFSANALQGVKDIYLENNQEILGATATGSKGLVGLDQLSTNGTINMLCDIYNYNNIVPALRVDYTDLSAEGNKSIAVVINKFNYSGSFTTNGKWVNLGNIGGKNYDTEISTINATIANIQILKANITGGVNFVGDININGNLSTTDNLVKIGSNNTTTDTADQSIYFPHYKSGAIHYNGLLRKSGQNKIKLFETRTEPNNNFVDETAPGYTLRDLEVNQVLVNADAIDNNEVVRLSQFNTRLNTKANLTSASFTGDVSVGGNLLVSGTTTNINTVNLDVKDSIVKIARDNNGDILDIGQYGRYQNLPDTIYRYTGVYRDATDKVWKFFSGLSEEPTNTINTSGGGYTNDDILIKNLNMAGGNNRIITENGKIQIDSVAGNSIIYLSNTNHGILRTDDSTLLGSGVHTRVFTAGSSGKVSLSASATPESYGDQLQVSTSNIFCKVPLDCNNQKITNVANPTNSNDVVNLTHFNNNTINRTQVGNLQNTDSSNMNLIIGGTVFNKTYSFGINELNMNSAKIVSLGNPTNDGDAVNVAHLNNNFLNLQGGAITGNLNLNGVNQYLNLNNNYRIKGGFLENKDVNGFTFIKSDQLTNIMNINDIDVRVYQRLRMENNFISNIANPVNPQDCATKAYVDGNYPSLSVNIPDNGVLTLTDANTRVIYIAGYPSGSNKRYPILTRLLTTGLIMNNGHRITIFNNLTVPVNIGRYLFLSDGFRCPPNIFITSKGCIDIVRQGLDWHIPNKEIINNSIHYIPWYDDNDLSLKVNTRHSYMFAINFNDSSSPVNGVSFDRVNNTNASATNYDFAITGTSNAVSNSGDIYLLAGLESNKLVKSFLFNGTFYEFTFKNLDSNHFYEFIIFCANFGNPLFDERIGMLAVANNGDFGTDRIRASHNVPASVFARAWTANIQTGCITSYVFFNSDYKNTKVRVSNLEGFHLYAVALIRLETVT